MFVYLVGFAVYTFASQASGEEVRCNATCPCPAFNPWFSYSYYPDVSGNASDFVSCSYYVDDNNTDYTVYQTYSCPPGFVFALRTSQNDQSPLCRPSSQSGSQFDCTGRANRSYPVTNSPSLYYACNGNGQATALNTCPYGMLFIEDSQKCDLKCTSIGTFGYSDVVDGTGDYLCTYYSCTYDFLYLRFNMEKERCAAGTAFDPTMQLCVGSASTACA